MYEDAILCQDSGNRHNFKLIRPAGRQIVFFSKRQCNTIVISSFFKLANKDIMIYCVTLSLFFFFIWSYTIHLFLFFLFNVKKRGEINCAKYSAKNRLNVFSDMTRSFFFNFKLFFHLITQVDTSFILSLLLIECQKRYNNVLCHQLVA